jgi:hypothetical protein
VGSLIAPGAQGAPQGPSPAPARPNLEALARRLESAVAHVGPSAQALTGGPDTTQGVHVAGLGVVIVLPARALPQQRRLGLRGRMREQAPETSPASPAPPRVVALAPPAAPPALEQLQRELEQEMAARAQLMEAIRQAQQGDDALLQRALQLQVLAIREQAEAFSIAVERARQRAERELRVQLDTLQRMSAASPPPAAAPSTLPTPPPAVDAAPAAGPAPPPEPPWRAWIGAAQEAAQLNQAMVEQVREALVSALEAHGAELSGLSPQETVTVAVDFVGTAGPLGMRPRVRGTLVLRALVGDVQARQAGRLGMAEFRQRVQARLY